MIFQPVWVSSVDHLRAFSALFHASPESRRLLGVYEIPPGFPYVEGLLGFPRFPLVLFAEGRLTVEPGSLVFEPVVRRRLLDRRRNLRTDWGFRLSAEDVVSVSCHQYTSPVASYFDLPWTRIVTRSGDDLLLSAAVTGPRMRPMRDRNRRLLAEVRAAFPRAGAVPPS